jgi:hypothetical protein
MIPKEFGRYDLLGVLRLWTCCFRMSGKLA